MTEPKTYHSAKRVIACTAVGTATLLFGYPAAAHAHISAEAGEAVAGERATVSFRVPNESDTAATTKIRVVFPADQPFAQVTPQAVSGWSTKITKEKLETPLDNHGQTVTEAVTSIEWTAGTIPPGQFQVFPVRIGPLPEGLEALVFKTVQTYSDGEVVRWIDEAEPGQPEPGKPAPTLAIQPATEAGHAEGEEHSDGDTLGRALGAGGLTAGLAALGLVLADRLRGTSRRRAIPAARDGVAPDSTQATDAPVDGAKAPAGV